MIRTPARAAVLLGLLVVLWCAPTAWMRATTGARTTADEPQYLMSARSLWVDRDLDVANQRAAGDYRSYHEVGLPLQEAIEADGSRVSPHDPLLPALLALPTGMGGWLAAKLTLALLAGVLAGLTAWTAIVRFGVRTDVALLVVGACSLSAPLAVYSTQVYPEIVAALGVAVVIAAATGDLTRRSLRLVALGGLVSLVWLSVKYAPVVVALAAVVLARLWRTDRRSAVVFSGLGALAAVAFAVLHLRWYGGLTPYAAGSHFSAGELTVSGADPNFLGRAGRLGGLLFDRNFGLVIWQPLFLALVPAAAALMATRQRDRLVLLAPLAAGWLNATFVALTMHGWWFPGRQLVVVLPAAVLAITWLVARAPRLVPWVVAAALLGATLVAWLTVEVLVTDVRLITTFSEMHHPWWELMRTVLPDGRRAAPLDRLLLILWSGGAIALGGWAWSWSRSSISIGAASTARSVQGALS